jgi:hypothetical protein
MRDSITSRHRNAQVAIEAFVSASANDLKPRLNVEDADALLVFLNYPASTRFPLAQPNPIESTLWSWTEMAKNGITSSWNCRALLVNQHFTIPLGESDAPRPVVLDDRVKSVGAEVA